MIISFELLVCCQSRINYWLAAKCTWTTDGPLNFFEVVVVSFQCHDNKMPFPLN